MSKEKDQHINVFVRVKPMGKTDTLKASSTTAVKVASDKELIVYEPSQNKVTRRFTFDRVFGPSCTQADVYNAVISPLLKEVIAGYNCTVFAYGQTNTGKTYTMEGEIHVDYNQNAFWHGDTSAGMIPRCLSHLFDELLPASQQCVVKVSYLELYNEELFDLLASDSDNATAATSKIKLYEDPKKGALVIHGLEEVLVHNKYEVYNIFERSARRRQTAATLLNANSSRSHTVFTITVHTKEFTGEDGGASEELLKTAKLNLVDLAGSENINKSGTVDKRMREARSINQSLLTLGRVITALVEKAPHVPYRESKLTRLLQESLGGRTKTSIIATVSLTGGNVEETLSTLDYAHRAKNITNYPEVNQRLCRRTLLKEYTREIENLKRDLLATREMNGVYLSSDSYSDLQMLIERQREEIKKKHDHSKILEAGIENYEKVINDLESQYDAQEDVLKKNRSELHDMTDSLKSMKERLRQVEDETNKKKCLVKKYVETENNLRAQAETLFNVVNEASEDAQKLHDKLNRKRKVEEKNEELESRMMDDLTEHCKDLESVLSQFEKRIYHHFQSVSNKVESQIIMQAGNMETMIRSITNNAVDQHFEASKKLKNIINASYTCYQKALSTHVQNASRMMKSGTDCLVEIQLKLDMLDILKLNEIFKKNLQTLHENISQKLENASAHVKLAVETVCRNRLEEFNYLNKNLYEISEHVEWICCNKKQVVENYEEFGKKMHSSRTFCLLDKCEENYSEIINASRQIDEICNKMCIRIKQTYNADMIVQKDLRDFLENIVAQIKSDFEFSINQVQKLSATALDKGNVLLNNLRERLNFGCAALKQCNNNVQFNGEQLQQKMAEDKSAILASSAIIYKTVESMDFTHGTFMEQQQHKVSEFSKKIDDKLIAHDTNLNNWNNDIIEKLHISQQKIDKFLTEGFRQDVPTDTTPPKRKFFYPHKLATLQPAEFSDSNH